MYPNPIDACTGKLGKLDRDSLTSPNIIVDGLVPNGESSTLKPLVLDLVKPTPTNIVSTGPRDVPCVPTQDKSLP